MLQEGETLGRYTIIELIGSGGMGEVYLAEDSQLRRRVALKLFTLDEGAGARDRLLHEARAASALSHPNVCTIFEVGDAQGRPFIAMEHVEGRTLETLAASAGLPAESVVRYGVQIADAVAHAHANGVIHRDLKAANVVITSEGRAKVLDFGLASTAAGEADTGTRDLTSAEIGGVSGTLSYLAPEVLRGRPADARSDIWALGVVLYEILVGRLPFRGETPFEVSTAIMRESAEVPGEVPEGLKAIVRRCLQKSPGERYQSAAEVRAALEMVLSGPTPGFAGKIATTGPEHDQSRRWPVLVGALAVIALVAGVVWRTLGGGWPGAMVGFGAGEETVIGASGRPTLAVLPFRDHTGSAELEWMASGVPRMLLTSLAQTPGLDIVSNSRVRQIVQQLGDPDISDLDAQTLAEFARRSGAGAVVVGDLYRTGTDYRFDVRVEDVDGGRVLSAYSATGPEIFDLVDDVSARIRDEFAGDAPGSAQSITAMLTDSLEAWRYYDSGLEARRNVRYPDAIAAFEQAIRIDPDFAMAYFQLADLRVWLPDPRKADEYESIVLDNMDRIPERDRLFVQASFVLERDEDPERAAEMLEDLVRRFPDHESAWMRLARAYGMPSVAFTGDQIDALERAVRAIPASGILHNQLGYAYLDRGRYPEAIRAIERYVELNPDEPNAYDSLAEIYTVSGQPERGLERYTELLAIEPEWAFAYLGRTMTLAMLGRYEAALEEVEKYQEAVIQAGSAVSAYGMTRAYLLAKIGRYEEALTEIRRDSERASRLGISGMKVAAWMLGADIALEAEDVAVAGELASRAIENVASVEDLEGRRGIELAARAYRGIVSVREGDLVTARQELERVEARARELEYDYNMVGRLRGEIDLAAGDLERAEATAATLEPELKAYYSHAQTPPTLILNNTSLRDLPARVKVAQGDLEAAIRIYRDLLTVDMGSKYTSFLDPRYVLKLARLLDETGQAEAAREQYLRFAELWEGADPRFRPLMEEARRRAAELAVR